MYRIFRFGIREMVKECKLWEMKYQVAHIQNHPVRKCAYACASVSEVHCKVSGKQAFPETHVDYHKFYCQKSDWVMVDALKSVSCGTKII